MSAAETNQKYLYKSIVASVDGAHRFFARDLGSQPSQSNESKQVLISRKLRDEYLGARELPKAVLAQQKPKDDKTSKSEKSDNITEAPSKDITTVTQDVQKVLTSLNEKQNKLKNKGIVAIRSSGTPTTEAADMPLPAGQKLVRKRRYEAPKPDWHAPWKLSKVISGHIGWVRSLAVEPGNKWFASGAADRTIKIWDLASGTLKLTLTGHISPVRGLVVSPRHPYLFSCGEDKMIKCWDLEQNKVVRQYHGHLSGIYTMALHPTLDVLVTAGRDSTARVWDIRTKQAIHVLSGHSSTVASVQCQEADPQVITSSMDSTVRLWDLAAGKSMAVLTHHKKSVRATALHPTEFGFITGSTDSIKQWRCPRGELVQNFEGHNSIINALSVNVDNVVFSGGDNGSMHFWDWKSGHCFQKTQTPVQPGSLDSEAGIFCSTFDRTGLRLITGEADKSIKIWKEDETATEETHPINWQPSLVRHRY